MTSKYFEYKVIFLLICARSTTAQNIKVWTDHHSQGTEAEISIAQCSNLPMGIAHEVTSINTNGRCASFYDGANCTGNYIEVMPRSPSHGNLHSWGFNDKAVSVGPCRDNCHLDVTGGTLIEVEPVDLIIYSRKDFKGAYQAMKVRGCSVIPPRFTLQSQLQSVKVFDKCVQFYSNAECRTSGDNADNIELRKGTPHHEDFSRWAFFEARSVSHCSYKCNQTAVQINSQTTDKETFPSEPHQVTLYDAPNYKGNWKKLTVKSCIDIVGDWEGMAASIKTFNKTCIILYDKRGCIGDTQFVPEESPDLAQKNFDGLARSIKPCYNNGGTGPGPQSKPLDNKTSNDGSTKEESVVTASSLSPLIISLIVIGPLLGILISVLLVLLMMRRCNPYKNIVQKLSDKEIDEFLSGMGMDLGVTGNGLSISDDYSVELLAQNKPYNSTYEILRSDIKFDAKSPLGMGEFGVVYKGTIRTVTMQEDGATSIKTITAAVKTVKPGSTINCLRSLLKEIKVMLYVGKHNHIVQLIGCCTEKIREGEIYALLEFCTRGSMESFLDKNKSNFRNIVRKGRLDESKMTGYSNFNPKSKSEYSNVLEDFSQQFDFFQLLRWCTQIADAMDFLATRKVIHSDLAARNVLLDESFQAKLSDFGLSRQLYAYTQYVKKHQEPLPWRWLAIESLSKMEFTSKSDVWSIGVLFWEIFSIGEKPYPGVVWSDDFLRNLKDGLRLSKPKYAVSECYNIMIKCWNEDPDNRPTFSEILEELRDIDACLQQTHSQTWNPTYCVLEMDP